MVDKVKYIQINALGQNFKVWTKQFGKNDSLKVLMLHGGPGASCSLFDDHIEPFEEAGLEMHFYNQLGSDKSDNPKDVKYWTIERFVEEVEQVRISLGMNKDNFILLGLSWGSMLAMEYALKYQDNLKGLVLSSMTASIPDYIQYEREVLAPQLGSDFLSKVMKLEEEQDFSEQYEALLQPFYENYVLRKPMEEWPKSVLEALENLNLDVYNYMNGPSEFGCVGTFKNWSVKERLKEIIVPTLVIGSKYNTMDPAHTKWMSEEVKNGQYLFCPNGSHLCNWDDPEVYFPGLIKFIKSLD